MPRRPGKRDTTRYHFKKGNKIVHTGITNNPKRREAEHQEKVTGGRLVKQGPKVTRKSAEKWEREQTRRGKPTTGYRT